MTVAQYNATVMSMYGPTLGPKVLAVYPPSAFASPAAALARIGERPGRVMLAGSTPLVFTLRLPHAHSRRGRRRRHGDDVPQPRNRQVADVAESHRRASGHVRCEWAGASDRALPRLAAATLARRFPAAPPPPLPYARRSTSTRTPTPS